MPSKNEREIDKLVKDIEKSVKLSFSKKNTKKYAEFHADDIVKRTRLGFGNDRIGGKKKRLLPLKESTINQRRKLASKGELHRLTSPGRSNLTRTGKLLDAIKGEAKDETFGITIDSNRPNEKVTNDEIVFYQELQGRSFINPTDLELKRLKDLIRNEFLDSLKKQFKK